MIAARLPTFLLASAVYFVDLTIFLNRRFLMASRENRAMSRAQDTLRSFPMPCGDIK